MPAYGAGGTATGGGTRSTISLAAPSGVVANKVVVAVIWCDGGTDRNPTLSGWVEAEGSPVAANDQNLHVLWHRASGSEAGPYAFVLDSSTYCEGQAHRIDDAVTSGTPFDTPTDTGTDGSGAGGSVSPAVDITTEGADRLIVHACGNWSGGSNWTPHTGYTERQDIASDHLSFAGTVTQASQGSTGTVQATLTGGSGRRTAWLGALKPVEAVANRPLQSRRKTPTRRRPQRAYYG